MSKFNKKTLAVALVAALTLPATAFAFELRTGDDTAPEEIASQQGPSVTMTQPVQLFTELGDVVIGRTTGFQVLIKIEDGGKFAAAPSLVAAAGLQGDPWTVALAAGGTNADDSAQFTVSPGENSTVRAGYILSLNGLQLSGISTTAPTRMSVQLRDPVSGATLHADTRQIIVRNNGLAVDCTAATNPARIDVGGDNPKAEFVEFVPGVGYPIGGGNAVTTDLGVITLRATSGFSFTPSTKLTHTIMGNFAGFESVFLASDATCETGGPEFVINDANTMATLNETGFLTGTSRTSTLCVTVDGTTQLAAQTFEISTSVNDTAVGGTCAVAPLRYNGSVVNVYHVNPAGNTTAQSFVRVINPSATDGRVTINGIDDAGQPSSGSVSFDLPARGSMQLNSEDLENGNTGKGLTGSLGDGMGKWRLEVTGEFQGMLVQGLNRNTVNGTVTNLTDADSEVEQRLLHEGAISGR